MASGVLMSVNNNFVRLMTEQGSAPSDPITVTMMDTALLSVLRVLTVELYLVANETIAVTRFYMRYSN